MQETIFLDVAIIVCTVVLLVLVMRMLRQPIIISYILAGIILSPYGLNVIRSYHELEIFSHMGVSFLLFMVGLGLNPTVIRDLGRVSLVTGVGQVVFTSIIGYGIGRVLGFDAVTALYVAVALTFSSTIIIMKLLTDKGEADTLYGRISIGFLIVQDVIAMLILLAISSLSVGGSWVVVLGTAFLKLSALAAVLVAVGIYVLPRLLNIVASSQELLLLFSIGWCFAVGALCAALGLSIEIGALAAGMVLSLSPFRIEIASKLRPLRDFFIVLFFVLLGSQMVFTDVTRQLLPIAIFSAFILIGNPLIVLLLMSAMRYTSRNSFKAGLTVAQISEFSFILIALGVRMGHLHQEVLALVTVVGIVTIAGSTYFIIYADQIYRFLRRFLRIFERDGHKVDRHSGDTSQKYDVLLLGYNRIGLSVLDALHEAGNATLVVDYDPSTVRELGKRGVDCRYGDLADTEFLEDLDFSALKMVISTLRDFETTRLIVRHIRRVNHHAIVIAVSHQLDQALALYEDGATYVITPDHLGGYHTATMIREYGFDMKRFLAERNRHLEHIQVIWKVRVSSHKPQ